MKTNQLIKIATLLFSAMSLASCEKEIIIKHNSKESRLVIEAEFDAGKQVNSVKLSKTIGISSDNAFPAASGAKITLSSDNGYFEELTEGEAGNYQTKAFSASPGSTYTLKVFFEGKTYEGQSIAPDKVALDTFQLSQIRIGPTDAISILPAFKDPAGVSNYYSFVRYHNGEKLKGTILMTDELSDGKFNMQPIYTSDVELKTGDQFRLEMRSIDEKAYNYLSSKMQTANQQSAAPANPLSNFSAGALGYFSIYAAQAKQTTVNWP